MTTLPHFPSVNILNGEKKKKEALFKKSFVLVEGG